MTSPLRREAARFAIGFALVLLMANDIPYSADAWLRYIEKQLSKRKMPGEQE